MCWGLPLLCCSLMYVWGMKVIVLQKCISSKRNFLKDTSEKGKKMNRRGRICYGKQIYQVTSLKLWNENWWVYGYSGEVECYRDLVSWGNRSPYHRFPSIATCRHLEPVFWHISMSGLCATPVFHARHKGGKTGALLWVTHRNSTPALQATLSFPAVRWLLRPE